MPLTWETVAVQAAAERASRMANEDLPQRFKVRSHGTDSGVVRNLRRAKPSSEPICRLEWYSIAISNDKWKEFAVTTALRNRKRTRGLLERGQSGLVLQGEYKDKERRKSGSGVEGSESDRKPKNEEKSLTRSAQRKRHRGHGAGSRRRVSPRGSLRGSGYKRGEQGQSQAGPLQELLGVLGHG